MKARALCAAFFLAHLVLFAPSANAANWIDSADVSWYDEGQTEFTISTEQQLAGLAKLVNDGNTFQDKTVRLDTDLSLVERDWAPIGSGASAGTVEMRFRGTFSAG